MANPLQPLGALNRLRGSISFIDFPGLNITAPFLGPEGININPEGDITNMLETMTGLVPSPAPFQQVVVEVELLKSQSFSDLFKQQIELDSQMGDFVVRMDTATLSNYPISNSAITQAGPGRINGRSVGFMISFRGAYYTNSALFDAS